MIVDSASPLQTKFPHRAKFWQLRSRKLEFGTCPSLMGIVNVTPDSFSDGGQFLSVSKAVDHALQLMHDGADVLDIGGESTRPYADAVSPGEELKRVLPVIQRLAGLACVPISIDTSKAAVAAEALQAGAEIVNDVTALCGDEKMVDTILEHDAGICAMHMQGTPRTMQDDPRYADVTQDVFAYLRSRRDCLIREGVADARICLDPGIGFGKTHRHNLTLMSRCGVFHDLGCPVLVGHSRKGFIGKVLQDKDADRTAATIGSALVLAQQGIQIIRVHDVLPIHQALLLFTACGGIDGNVMEV